jgi:hypothetical protein
LAAIQVEGFTAAVKRIHVNQAAGNDLAYVTASVRDTDYNRGKISDITLDGGAGRHDKLSVGLHDYSTATIINHHNGSFTLNAPEQGLTRVTFRNYEDLSFQLMAQGLDARTVTIADVENATRQTPAVSVAELLANYGKSPRR